MLNEVMADFNPWKHAGKNVVHPPVFEFAWYILEHLTESVSQTKILNIPSYVQDSTFHSFWLFR
jgi:hypothetical protein